MLSTSPVPVVRVHGLRKSYGPAIAVNGLELTVNRGEVHGFLGPNGAGKSTTLRILLGLVHRTAGEVEVFGRDPWPDPTSTNRDVAYVPGDVALWPNLTGGETIDLLLNSRGGGDRGEVDRLIEAFDLDPRKKARTYSKGNRQKVALVAAFARRAPLYVLDEPTSGLDPLIESVFRKQIERVRNAGSTVLLSSHLLSEVEQLCDHVTIIRDGRTVESARLSDLVQGTATRFEVTATDIDAVSAVPGVTDVAPVAPTLESPFLRHYQADDR